MSTQVKQTNPTLSNALIMLACAGVGYWGMTLANLWLSLAVSGASYAAFDIHRKKYKYNPRQLVGECIQSTTPLFDAVGEKLQEIEPGDNVSPITRWGYKFLTSMFSDRPESLFNWFTTLRFGMGAGFMPYGVWMICGEQREGKTVIAKYLLNRFLDQHPGCALQICDIENESHPEGYWHGIPVASTVDEVLSAFNMIEQYMNTAKGNGEDPGLVVVFDELKSTFKAMNDKQRKRVISIQQDCTSKGAKRKVLLIDIMHTLAAGVLGWGGFTDFAPKANILMLQKFANDDSNFSNLQDSNVLDDVREEIGAEKVLPMNSDAPRPCLLYVDKQWSMRWVPQLQEIEMTVREGDEPDPYCHIREFFEDIELPDEELGLNQLLRLCGANTSTHKSRDGKYYSQWIKFLSEHNRAYEVNSATSLEPDRPPRPPEESWIEIL